MKHFKQFVAVLLAGVMMLAMLTACGSTGSAAVENEILKMVQEVNSNLTNDSTLRSVSATALNEIKDDQIALSKALSVKTEDSKVQITYVFVEGVNLSIGSSNLDVQLKPMAYGSTGMPAQLAVLKASAKAFTKFGVATRVIGDKTYVAVTVQGSAGSVLDGILNTWAGAYLKQFVGTAQ